MGSGGMIVVDGEQLYGQYGQILPEFTCDESCGKCTPCRVGTRKMYQILDRITKGEGQMEDLKTLEELANMIKRTSLCGLGQSAPNPVLSTLQGFYDEYISHIR